MEPLSIASGVAGLLTAAASIIKVFDKVKTTLEDCPRTVIWAHAETRELHWAIERLKGLIDDPDSVPKTARMSVGIHDATVTISELVTTCDRLISTLKPLDENRALNLNKWDKVQWFRVQDEVVKYIREMQAHKSSVTLILNILQCSDSDVVIMESQDKLAKKIERVLQNSELTQQRVEKIEALFNTYIAENPALFPSNRSSVGTTLANWKEDDDETENSSVATSHKEETHWNGFHSSERSLSFPLQESMVPQISRPIPKRTSSAETTSKASNGISSPPRKEFEETLEKSHVYQRVYNSTDTFSITSARNRSMAGSVMTSFSLADNSSILSAFPIMSRTELKHPEYYVQMSGNQRLSKDLMRAITMRSVVKSPIEPSPEAPFSLKQFRSPPNCGANVMGRWSNSRTKIWKAKEFRTEIQFEVPFIFVSTPRSTDGPIQGAQVYFIDGTRKSLDDTRTDLDPPPTDTRNKAGRVIKNERATWLTLLSSLQKMENQSQNWTRQQIMSLRPRPASAQAILSSISGKHGLRAALQSERKSWDDMPPSVNRPYATTTMSQLIEMLAMLGIYWRDFNPTYNVYQAEGNGYLVKGHKISGFGIMFYFQALDKAVFEENRPIPDREAMRLAFGQLPTILSPRKVSNGDTHDSPFIRLASRTDVADTLTSFGCDRKSANYFLKEGAVISHIFPVTFELMGMIGQIFHIRDLCFRYIPNPCYFAWCPREFSLPKLLISYRKYLQQETGATRGQLFHHLNTLLAPKTEIQLQRDTPVYGWQAQDALHSVLEKLDETLRNPGDSQTPSVYDVIRSHFDEVLCQMNAASNGQTFPRFGGADKEDLLMKTYFQEILPALRLSFSATFFKLKESDAEFNAAKSEDARKAECAAYLFASNELWCTLILRMICWLMLHDFHSDDVQIPKGHLYGSEMRVYIS
ncbi:hypothetical protein FIE12Z_5914 [Fusarium flagelliforme]|uniref:Modin n=1 Tax=Fusarium flagelliforme TaxID=2675880 RepID=A0A395MPI6_9HYPO|nr:hypothetical protein FIE12Z_5914 [Fusarium flagelliforme]